MGARDWRSSALHLPMTVGGTIRKRELAQQAESAVTR
jgi:hypothetical protein